MFLHVVYNSISICYCTTAAVFTLGKLMNVKEDYGELSSIARSVHVINTVSRPHHFYALSSDTARIVLGLPIRVLLTRGSSKPILNFDKLHSGRDLGVHAAVCMVDL
jgi:hypothetical protein